MLAAPGPIPERQDASHPHGVLVDPSGRFVLVPDLGADLVRIFRICPTTGQLEEQQPLAVAPGSGPRHAVFWVPRNANLARLGHVRFFLVSELDNYLRGYDVIYPKNGTLLFTKFYEGNTYGGSTPPTGSKAAGIAISVRLFSLYTPSIVEEDLLSISLPQIAPEQPSCDFES